MYQYIFNLQIYIYLSQINIFIVNKSILLPINILTWIDIFVLAINNYVAREYIFFIANKYFIINKYVLFAINILL